MNYKDDCLFCKVYSEGKEVAWENKFFYARFDRFPITPGHIEVIPKSHVESLLGLSIAEWIFLQEALWDVVSYVEATSLEALYNDLLLNPVNESSAKFCRKALEQLEKTPKPSAYNYGVNDGEAAGRTIHHLHIHIIPRYIGDVENPRGGVRHIIPQKGNY